MHDDLPENEGSPLIQHPGVTSQVLEKILVKAPVGIVIVDKDGRIVFFNGEAEKIFGYPAEEVIGQPVELLQPEQFHHAHVLQRENYLKKPSDRVMGHDRNVFGRRKDGSELPLEVGLSYIHSGSTVLVSAVVVDISRRKRVEAEREVLIGELQAALEKVKQLSGLLPICASCKKIKDDNGYWNQIESYIRDHSEAEFSHGICPDCAKKLYPELFGDP